MTLYNAMNMASFAPLNQLWDDPNDNRLKSPISLYLVAVAVLGVLEAVR